jgi:IclR family acetate operon transcriptional repressor
VRAAEQVLDLYKCFAEAQEPLAFSELARRLDMAPSTCFNLVRTFETRGFLYATGPRRALYPTKRMLALVQEIARHDPVGSDVTARLSELRDATGETVLLASLIRDRVTFLEVLESPHSIRYSAAVGETRPVQRTSLGKALLSLMSVQERLTLVKSLTFEKVTDRTLATAEAYLSDIETSVGRGWFLNDGESVPDVIVVAAPVIVHGSAFAVGVAGPRHRMVAVIGDFAARLLATCGAIAKNEGAAPARAGVAAPTS